MSNNPLVIDIDEVKHTISMIVQGWAGGNLNEIQRQVLDRFIQEEVKPLKPLELLDRMVTPAATLDWFLTYFQTQVSELYCETEPGQTGGCACYAA